MKSVEAIKKYVRAANYISAAQIYLQDNILLEQPMAFDDIKPRLLGHWGTCPGINFVYANLNYLIKKHEAEMLFVLGPGHGFPGLKSQSVYRRHAKKLLPASSGKRSRSSLHCQKFQLALWLPEPF